MLKLAPDNLFRPYDIVFLTETFLTTEYNIANTHYSISVMAEQGAMGRPKGGISCLIKKILSPFTVPHKSEHTLVVRTTICALICVYFQPELSPANIITEISQCLSTINKDDPVILAGDLNCRLDIASQKTTEILNYLEEEGFALVNNTDAKTYVSHNGSST